jgi:hypothetical protein
MKNLMTTIMMLCAIAVFMIIDCSVKEDDVKEKKGLMLF